MILFPSKYMNCANKFQHYLPIAKNFIKNTGKEKRKIKRSRKNLRKRKSCMNREKRKIKRSRQQD